MALDFPTSPTNGQSYTSNGLTYTYDSTYGVWKVNPVPVPDVYGTANAAFNAANAAPNTARVNTIFDIANASFGNANTTHSFAIAAFSNANTTHSFAIAAFGKANNIPTPGSANSVILSNGTSWVSGVAPGFASGTVMLFVQTSAPTGWTKSTTHNDKALRVVSGAASNGGTVAFTTAFASKSVTGKIGRAHV